MKSLFKTGTDASCPGFHLVTKRPALPSFGIVCGAKSWAPLSVASLGLNHPPAELVLLLDLESKCFFNAKLIELGPLRLETALSFLGQVGYKNKCALLLCASTPG